jgi:hypothetical protein
MLIQIPPLLYKPQSRKLNPLRLAPHDEMQHNRHRDKRRPGQQCWCYKAHLDLP